MIYLWNAIHELYLRNASSMLLCNEYDSYVFSETFPLWCVCAAIACFYNFCHQYFFLSVSLISICIGLYSMCQWLNNFCSSGLIWYQRVTRPQMLASRLKMLWEAGRMVHPFRINILWTLWPTLPPCPQNQDKGPYQWHSGHPQSCKGLPPLVVLLPNHVLRLDRDVERHNPDQ